MPDRHDERYRGDDYRSERYGRGDRGLVDRAGDEVRSWFGDDAAERRRQMDEARERGERGWGSERTGRPERWSLDEGRVEYDRSGAAYRGWNEPNYGYRPAYGYAPGEWSASIPRSDTVRRNQETHGYYEDSRGRLSEFDHPRYSNYGSSYAGRGPKGYQRSDARITEDVCDRLCDDPRIDATDIEVLVKNGEVTLAGMVHTREEKRRTEDLIESVSGVRDVHNNLRVERWMGQSPSTGTNPPEGTTIAGQPSANTSSTIRR